MKHSLDDFSLDRFHQVVSRFMTGILVTILRNEGCGNLLRTARVNLDRVMKTANCCLPIFFKLSTTGRRNQKAYFTSIIEETMDYEYEESHGPTLSGRFVYRNTSFYIRRFAAKQAYRETTARTYIHKNILTLSYLERVEQAIGLTSENDRF